MKTSVLPSACAIALLLYLLRTSHGAKLRSPNGEKSTNQLLKTKVVQENDYAVASTVNEGSNEAVPGEAIHACNSSDPPANGAIGDCPEHLDSGKTCNPNCNSGYTVSGSTSCSAGTLVAATCDPSPCAVQAPTNGVMGSCPVQLADKGTCSPACNKGFSATGVSSCSLGTLNAAVCNPSPCPFRQPVYGKAGDCPGQLLHGEFCSPTCDAGYIASGLTNCSYGVLGSATCEPLRCDASQPPANGDVGDCPVSLESGKACRPTCKPGYNASGPSFCQMGLLIPATCVPATCKATKPLNGTFGNCPAKLFHGETCEPVCDIGFTASGLSTCQFGTFVSATCSAAACTFQPPTNGDIGTCSQLIAHGSSCSPSCNKGYTLSGLSSCTFGSFSSAICVPNSCPVESPANGQRGSCPDTLTHGGSCLPECDIGYSVSGVSSCKLGVFTSASCTPSPCTVQAPTFGIIGSCPGMLKDGETCTPTCNAGYNISGVSKCSLGFFSSATCSPFGCTPTAPENGDAGTCTGQLGHGSICSPVCNAGYTVSGRSHCSFGEFTSAVCTPSTCLIQAPENGLLGTCQSHLDHNATCEPQCNAGYKLNDVTSCSFGSLKKSVCEQVVKVTLKNNGAFSCSSYCGNNMNEELNGWKGACCLGADKAGTPLSCTTLSDGPIKCSCQRNDDVPFVNTRDPEDGSFVCQNGVSSMMNRLFRRSSDKKTSTDKETASSMHEKEVALKERSVEARHVQETKVKEKTSSDMKKTVQKEKRADGVKRKSEKGKSASAVKQEVKKDKSADKVKSDVQKDKKKDTQATEASVEKAMDKEPKPSSKETKPVYQEKVETIDVKVEVEDVPPFVKPQPLKDFLAANEDS